MFREEGVLRLGLPLGIIGGRFNFGYATLGAVIANEKNERFLDRHA